MIKYFTSKSTLPLFKLFSFQHIMALLSLLLVIVVSIIVLRNKNEKIQKIFRYTLAGILLLSEIVFFLWRLFNNILTIQYSLPLQICTVTLFLTIALLIWEKKTFFEIVYFWGIFSSGLALITPILHRYSFPHIRFFNFFISHGFVFLTVMYYVFVRKFRPKLKSIIKVYIITIIFIMFVAIINLILKTNYLYIMRDPNVPTITSLLGPWPWSRVAMFGIVTISFIILYIPFFIENKFILRKQEKSFLKYTANGELNEKS